MLTDIKTAFFMATREIKRGNKGTVIVTVFIMTLAVLNLLFMPCLLDGMDHKNKLQVIDAKFGHVVIEPKEGDSLILNPRSLQKKINSFNEVQGVSLQYSVGATLYYNDKSLGRSITFIDPIDEDSVTTIAESIVEGSYLSKLDTDEILIGSESAGTHNPIDISNSLGGIATGDYVEIKYNNGIIKKYRVKGIYKTNFINADYSLFLNNKEMENIFGTNDRADTILIRLKKENMEYDFIKKLTQIGIGEDIFNSRDRAGLEISQIFGIIKMILAIIAILVSVTTLFIVIYIDAINKRKIIAVINAIGVNRKIIIYSFIFQSIFYSVSGILIGLFLLYYLIVPYFIANPFMMPFGAVSLLVETEVVVNRMIALIVTAIIAGFVPAYQVTKQNIVEAMRS
ncbi:MAG: FtsX-like permease family protein [Candidatus Aenigmarchaeota archaeon]|nr:FtsX-like permease family protein [Candidatus Aenigmarchaeota archaeon]